MRHFNALRWWTRWSRKRARSRSARTPGVGSQISGTLVPAGQLSQDMSVNLVGLGGQGRQTLRFHRICDGHLPAQALEGVVDEPRPGHGLDDRADLLTVAQDAIGEGAQGVRVRVDGQDINCPTFLVENVHIEPLARQVQTGVQRSCPLTWCNS